MPNVAFWAYVSEAYFKDRTGVPRVGQGWAIGEVEVGNAEEEGWEEEELEEEIRQRGKVAEGLLKELRKRVAERVAGNGITRPTADIWSSLLHPSPYFSQLVSQYHSISRIPRTIRLPTTTLFCEICINCQGSPERPIATCSGCGLSVHVDCYGLKAPQPREWYCEICAVRELCERVPICAVCRKMGGAMKKGITLPVGDTGWAHVFCVESISEAYFLDESAKEGVDLQQVDPRRCSLHCELCPVSTGACLQCSFRNCLRSFHPTCWKSAFVHPFLPTTQVLVCTQHRENDDQLTRLDRAHTKELQHFVKDLTSSLPTPKSRETASKADIKLLINVAKESLHRHNSRRRKAGFAFVLDRKKRCAETDVPVEWNALSPEIFRAEGLSLPGRTQAESSTLYSACYSGLVKRLQQTVHEFGPQEATRLRVKMEEAGVRRKRRRDRPTLVKLPLRVIFAPV